MSERDEEAPNKGLLNIACTAGGVAAGLSEVPLLGLGVEFVCDRTKAKQRYAELQPIVLRIVELTGVDSAESKFMLNEIRLTATPGNRRHNFTRLYIENKQGWKKLPKTAGEIFFGYW